MTKKNLQYIFIWSIIILGVIFSKRMDIAPYILVDAGTRTFLEVTIANLLEHHKRYVFIMIISTAIICYLHNRSTYKQHSRWLFFLAGLFSFFHLIGVTYENSMTGVLLYHFSKPLIGSNISLLVGYFFIYLMVLELISGALDYYREQLECDKRNAYEFLSGKVKYPLIALLMFIGWVPYMLLCYPGTLGADEVYQLAQFWGLTPWTSHHPIVSTALMGSATWIGKLCGSMSFGVFLFMCIQAVIAAYLFTKIIQLYERAGIGRGVRIIVWSFFALLPLWGSFVQTVGKDFAFTLIMVAFTLWLYKNYENRTHWSLMSWNSLEFLLLCIGVTYLRNNGLYAVVATLIAMIVLWKEQRKTIVALTTIFVIIVAFVNIFFFTVLKIEKGSVRETLSIPFQQTARYVKEYESDISEEEQNIINTVLDYKTIGMRYKAYLSDPVKETYKEASKAELAEYFGVWFAQFLRHPLVYVDATLSNSYAYISPGSRWLWGYNYFAMDKNDFGIHYVWNEEIVSTVAMLDKEASRAPVLHYFYAPGTYIWLILFFCVYNLWKKQYRRNLIAVPSLVIFLTCIASPCLGCVRYALPYMACTPIIIVASIKKE
ncbi:MAG: DUF6020 family protein [Lachnospiraceae bacterium]|nr:DUF6020 family protein [Lachnospiraceae bacterium]